MAVQAYSILVVDDNEMNRDLLTRPLKRQGYQVTTDSSLIRINVGSQVNIEAKA